MFATPLADMILAIVADWSWITPNRLTVLSFCLTVVTSVLVILGDALSLIMAGVVLQVAYVADCMDGQLARYRHMASTKGAFYDKCSDFVKFPLVLMALTLASFERSGSVFPVALGLLCVFLVGYLPYLKLLAERDFDIKLWSGLSGSGFVSRNLRFFLFEEAQWYLIVSVCLFMDSPQWALILLVATQGVVAILRTWRIARLIHT